MIKQLLQLVAFFGREVVDPFRSGAYNTRYEKPSF